VSSHEPPASAHGGPRPGDPRSTGPRPRAGLRDVVWLTLAIGLATLTVWQVGRLAVVAATDPKLQVSGAGLVLAFAITVVWLLTVYWLVMGAWRRSVWGCPFEHGADATTTHRCPRHRLVGGDRTDGAVDGDGSGTTRPDRGPRP
jgi:hypothetical protein